MNKKTFERMEFMYGKNRKFTEMCGIVYGILCIIFI